MAQVDFVNYFSIIIWFNIIFICFYFINYLYIVPLIFNNLLMRSKKLQFFVYKNKIKYCKIFSFISENMGKIFNSYIFFRVNLNIYYLYSSFVVYKIILC